MKKFKSGAFETKGTIMELTLDHSDAEKYISALDSGDSHKFTIKCDSLEFDLSMVLVGVEHTITHVISEQEIKLTFWSAG